MNRSESINELAKALSAFQGKIKNVSKDSTNPFFKSKYASLPAILDEVRQPLSDCGLSISQLPSGENSLVTILLHESGQFLQSEYTMKPVKNDPQGIGSCITYMRRYAIQSVLGLGSEDDDANEASKPKSIDSPKRIQPSKDFEKINITESQLAKCYELINAAKEEKDIEAVVSKLKEKYILTEEQQKGVDQAIDFSRKLF